MEVYAKQVLSPGSYMVEREETVEASKVFVKEIAAFTIKRRVHSWTMPAEFVSTQTLLVDILHFRRKVQMDATSLEKCRRTLFLK